MEPTTTTRSLISFTDLYANVLRFYKQHYQIFLGIALVPAILSAFSFLADPQQSSHLILGSVLLFVSSIIGIFSMLATMVAIKKKDVHEEVTVGTAYKGTLALIIPIIVITVLEMIIILGGTLAFVIPGLIAVLFLMFSPYAFIISGVRGKDALANSIYYVRNNAWAVFWRILGGYVSIFIVTVAVNTITSAVLGSRSIVGGGILSFINAAVFAPLTTILLYMLYKHLRETKPELAGDELLKMKKLVNKLLIGSGILVLLAIGISFISIF
jgi:hypothetical protein